MTTTEALRARLNDLIPKTPMPWYDEADPDYSEAIDFLAEGLAPTIAAAEADAVKDWIERMRATFAFVDHLNDGGPPWSLAGIEKVLEMGPMPMPEQMQAAIAALGDER